jgi:hypothetical protein
LAAGNYCKKCLQLGSPWTKWNSMTERLEFLYVKEGFKDKMKREWSVIKTEQQTNQVCTVSCTVVLAVVGRTGSCCSCLGSCRRGHRVGRGGHTAQIANDCPPKPDQTSKALRDKPPSSSGAAASAGGQHTHPLPDPHHARYQQP